MSDCTRILFLEEAPDYLKVDGLVHLDLQPGTTLPERQSVYKLNDFNRLTDEATNSISLSVSSKNLTLLGESIHGQRRGGYRVAAFSGHSCQALDTLFVNRYENDEISCDLVYTNSLLSRASNLYLNQMDLGVVSYDVETVRQSIRNFARPDQLYSFIPVYYGGRKQFDIEALRPLINATRLLEIGFCSLGYHFSSELLQSLGYHWYCYLLSDNYLRLGQDSSVLNAFYRVQQFYDRRENSPRATRRRTENLEIEARPYVEVHDRVQFPFGVAYEDDGLKHIEIALRYALSTQYQNNEWYIEIYLGTELYHRERLPGSASSEFLYHMVEFDINIPTDESMVVVFNNTSPGASSLNVRYELRSYGDTVYIQRGDVYDLASRLHPDYTFLDHLKGLLHCINGELHVNEAERTVSIYPGSEAEVNGQMYESFVGRDNIYLNGQSCKTKALVFDREDVLRYQEFSFAKSDDPSFDDLEKPFGSRRLDLGRDFESAVESNENPFYQPTRNRKVVMAQAAPDREPTSIPYSTGIDMPVMLDNKEEEVSYQIGPRILHVDGAPSIFEQINDQYFEGHFSSPRDDLPFVYSYCLPNWYLTTSGQRPPFALIYGRQHTKADLPRYENLYAAFWHQSFINDVFAPLLELSVYNQDFETLRGRVVTHLDGHPIVGKIESLERNPCESSAVSLVLRKLIDTREFCDLLEDDPSAVPMPIISYQLENCQLRFEIENIDRANLLSSSWQVSADLVSWTEISSPWLPEISGDFYLRFIGLTDEGHRLMKTAYIPWCSGLSFQPYFSFDPDEEPLRTYVFGADHIQSACPYTVSFVARRDAASPYAPLPNLSETSAQLIVDGSEGWEVQMYINRSGCEATIYEFRNFIR